MSVHCLPEFPRTGNNGAGRDLGTAGGADQLEGGFNMRKQRCGGAWWYAPICGILLLSLASCECLLPLDRIGVVPAAEQSPVPVTVPKRSDEHTYELQSLMR